MLNAVQTRVAYKKAWNPNVLAVIPVHPLLLHHTVSAIAIYFDDQNLASLEKYQLHSCFMYHLRHTRSLLSEHSPKHLTTEAISVLWSNWMLHASATWISPITYCLISDSISVMCRFTVELPSGIWANAWASCLPSVLWSLDLATGVVRFSAVVCGFLFWSRREAS